MISKDVRYLQTHEWARQEADTGIVTVGISEFALEQLGDIVFLELPEAGTKISKGDMFGVIESVKAASDLYAPVSGEITEVNQQLTEKLELFKSDPYGGSWIVKIKPTEKQEFESLMDAKQYEEYLKEL